MNGEHSAYGRGPRSRTKLIVILVAVALILAGFVVLALWEQNHNKYPDQVVLEDTLKYQGKEYILRDDIETMLVLGLDTFDNESSGAYYNDKQADFLLLVIMDPSERTCKAIRINRDTMTEINVLGVAGDKIGTTTKQIALAHTYGNGREVSCRNTANAASHLLMGARVDHYVSLTMEAVSDYNDLLDGVTLEVLDDFSSVDPDLVEGETVTLTGEQALTYVRARYGMEDPTNAGRMKRQKQYLEAAYDKTRDVAAQDDAFLSRAVLQLADHLVSDCSGNKLELMLQRVSEYEIGEIYDIDGETRMGEEFLEFHPDRESVMEIVIDCFYELKP